MLKNIKRGFVWVASVCVVFAVLLLIPGVECRVITHSPLKTVSQETFDQAVQSMYDQNIFLVWLSPKVGKQLRDDLYECYTVKRRIRSLHRLHIIVEEKRPWLSCLVNQGTVFISQDGTILSPDTRLTPEESKQMLVVRGLHEDLFQDRKLDFTIIDTLQDLSDKMATYFPEQDLQLEYSDTVKWVILLNDTIPIYLGDGSNIESKFHALATFFSSKGSDKEGVSSIDIRINNRVVVAYGST